MFKKDAKKIAARTISRAKRQALLAKEAELTDGRITSAKKKAAALAAGEGRK